MHVPLKRALLAIALFIAISEAACTVPNPDYQPVPPEPRPDGALSDGTELAQVRSLSSCEPGAFVRCERDMLFRCGPEGLGTEVLECPQGCNPIGRACNECDPRTTVRCDGDSLVLCSVTGRASSQRCEHGCQQDHCLACPLETYYLDADQDGFGDSGAAITACEQPAGYVKQAGDCDDQDASAHPGQQGFFVAPSLGQKSFDYDCDGLLSRERPSVASCTLGGEGCGGDGWATTQVPGCGEGALFASCVPYGLVCGPWSLWQVQRCR